MIQAMSKPEQLPAPTVPPARRRPSPRPPGGGPGGPSTSPDQERKKVCAVCAVISDNHHIHYGALVCFSCRAFFRRAHSKVESGSSDADGSGVKSPNYVCKKDGKCDIADKNRKKCQRCRYDKCISVGMDPKQVRNKTRNLLNCRPNVANKTSIQAESFFNVLLVLRVVNHSSKFRF